MVTEHTPTFLPCTLVPLVLQKRLPAFDTTTFTFDDFGALIPAKTLIVFESTFLPTFTDNTRRTVDGDDTGGTVTDDASLDDDAVVACGAVVAVDAVLAPDDAAVVDGEPCACAASDDGVVVATVTATVVATVGTVTVAGTVGTGATVVRGAAVVAGTVLSGVVVPTFCAGVIPNPAIVTALAEATPTGAPLPRSPEAS